MAIDRKRRLAGRQLVDGRYVRQGCERCVRAGMSVAEISRITGIDRQVLDSLIHFKQVRITAKTLYAWVVSEPALHKRIKQLQTN